MGDEIILATHTHSQLSIQKIYMYVYDPDKYTQTLPVSETYCLTPPIRNVANTGEWSLVAISLVHPGNREVTTIVNTTD